MESYYCCFIKEKYWKAAILLRDQLRTHPRTKAGSKVTVTNEKWQLDFG